MDSCITGFFFVVLVLCPLCMVLLFIIQQKNLKIEFFYQTSVSHQYAHHGICYNYRNGAHIVQLNYFKNS